MIWNAHRSHPRRGHWLLSAAAPVRPPLNRYEPRRAAAWDGWKQLSIKLRWREHKNGARYGTHVCSTAFVQLIRFLSVTFSRINKTLVSCPCNTQTMRMTGSALPDGKTSTHKTAKEILRHEIYIYAFSRRFYPKRLTVHSGYTFSLVCAFPGNRTHNLLRCWRNALPLNHTGTHIWPRTTKPAIRVNFLSLRFIHYLKLNK